MGRIGKRGKQLANIKHKHNEKGQFNKKSKIDLDLISIYESENNSDDEDYYLLSDDEFNENFFLEEFDIDIENNNCHQNHIQIQNNIKILPNGKTFTIAKQGECSNSRNDGNSIQTFYRKNQIQTETQKVINKIEINNNNKSYFPTIDYLFKKQTNPDIVIVDTIKNNLLNNNNNNNNNNPIIPNKFTIDQAITHLKDEVATSKNRLHQNYHIQSEQFKIADCILKYLIEIKNNNAKVESSINVINNNYYLKNNFDSYKSKCLRKYSENFLKTGLLPIFKQGCHSKTISIIEDEAVQLYLKQYLRGLSDTNRNPKFVCNEIKNGLLNDFSFCDNFEISEETTRRWMIYIGFTPNNRINNYYSDGHQRSDVMLYSNTVFLPLMKKYENNIQLYDYDDNKNFGPIPNPNVNLIFITHDETTCYGSDCKNIVWNENGKRSLKIKSYCGSIMVSGFACACHGFINSIIDNKIIKSYELFEASKQNGYWTNDHLIAQLKEVIPLFQKIHPGKKLLFAFDNSQNHHKCAPDGLKSSIPLNDNKNMIIMRRTSFTDKDGKIWVQSMQTKNNIPKGAKTILFERGLYINKMPLECKLCKDSVKHTERINLEQNDILLTRQCCCRFALSCEKDFAEQKEWLTEIVENEGHNIIYYPKFHCEFNFIELNWSDLKRGMREMGLQKIAELRINIPNKLDSMSAEQSQKNFMHCIKYMELNRIGLVGPLADFAIRTYKSHRAINQTIIKEVENQYNINKTTNTNLIAYNYDSTPIVPPPLPHYKERIDAIAANLVEYNPLYPDINCEYYNTNLPIVMNIIPMNNNNTDQDDINVMIVDNDNNIPLIDNYDEVIAPVFIEGYIIERDSCRAKIMVDYDYLCSCGCNNVEKGSGMRKCKGNGCKRVVKTACLKWYCANCVI